MSAERAGKPARRRGPRRSAGGVAALPEGAAKAVQACFERKASDGVVLDLRGISNATDYFVIVSGDSDTHVRAIAEHVLETLKREGATPAGVEGLSAGRWVLIDCIDAVIHVFHPAAREYYSLERLWGDAPASRLRDPEEAP